MLRTALGSSFHTSSRKLQVKCLSLFKGEVVSHSTRFLQDFHGSIRSWEPRNENRQAEGNGPFFLGGVKITRPHQLRLEKKITKSWDSTRIAGVIPGLSFSEFDARLTFFMCVSYVLLYTLQGINISHLGKRKLVFKTALEGDMLVPRRVCVVPFLFTFTKKDQKRS